MKPLDVWRIAKVMVDKHGEYAPEECEHRADEFAAAGDGNSEELWEIIRWAAENILEDGPPIEIMGLSN